MKYIKKFENIDYTFDIEKLITREKVYAAFEAHGLSCDPNKNKFLNNVKYSDEINSIICYFTSYSYDGRVLKNILDILQKICDEIDADDFDFTTKFGSYEVIFEYSDETLKELEIKKNVEKYNL